MISRIQIANLLTANCRDQNARSSDHVFIGIERVASGVREYPGIVRPCFFQYFKASFVKEFYSFINRNQLSHFFDVVNQFNHAHSWDPHDECF